jgi:hypothetical protein
MMRFDRSLIGEGDPDESDALSQPHLGLVVELVTTVSGRLHLDDQLREDVGIAPNPLVQRQSLSGEEGDIRRTDGVRVALDLDPGVSDGDPAEALRLHKCTQLGAERGDHFSVFESRRHRLA